MHQINHDSLNNTFSVLVRLVVHRSYVKACREVQKQTCSVPTGFSAALSLIDKELRWAVSSLISLCLVCADIRWAAHWKWVDLQMPFTRLLHVAFVSEAQMFTVVSHNDLWSLVTPLQLYTLKLLQRLSKGHFGLCVWTDAWCIWTSISTFSSGWKLGLTFTFDCVSASVHILFISCVCCFA